MIKGHYRQHQIIKVHYQHQVNKSEEHQLQKQRQQQQLVHLIFQLKQRNYLEVRIQQRVLLKVIVHIQLNVTHRIQAINQLLLINRIHHHHQQQQVVINKQRQQIRVRLKLDFSIQYLVLLELENLPLEIPSELLSSGGTITIQKRKVSVTKGGDGTGDQPVSVPITRSNDTHSTSSTTTNTTNNSALNTSNTLNQHQTSNSERRGSKVFDQNLILYIFSLCFLDNF
jgi:hypothetical protein